MLDATALVIRPAFESERAAVTALWTRANLTTSYNDPATDFDFARGKSASEVLVGLFDGAVVASVMVGHDGHRGWLYYVAVDPDRRGYGYGCAIIAAAEAWLRDRGVPKAMLMVRDMNTYVVGFYEANGYETAPRVVMQKWLKPQA